MQASAPPQPHRDAAWPDTVSPAEPAPKHPNLACPELSHPSQASSLSSLLGKHKADSKVPITVEAAANWPTSALILGDWGQATSATTHTAAPSLEDLADTGTSCRGNTIHLTPLPLSPASGSFKQDVKDTTSWPSPNKLLGWLQGMAQQSLAAFRISPPPQVPASCAGTSCSRTACDPVARQQLPVCPWDTLVPKTLFCPHLLSTSSLTSCPVLHLMYICKWLGSGQS